MVVVALGAVRQRADRPRRARSSARYVLPETARNRGRFDLAGALTSTLGMVGLVYGFVHAAESGWSALETIGSFAVGLVLLGCVRR